LMCACVLCALSMLCVLCALCALGALRCVCVCMCACAVCVRVCVCAVCAVCDSGRYVHCTRVCEVRGERTKRHCSMRGVVT